MPRTALAAGAKARMGKGGFYLSGRSSTRYGPDGSRSTDLGHPIPPARRQDSAPSCSASRRIRFFFEHRHRSITPVAAGASGFRTLIQSGHRPDRYGLSRRLATIPPNPWRGRLLPRRIVSHVVVSRPRTPVRSPVPVTGSQLNIALVNGGFLAVSQ